MSNLFSQVLNMSMTGSVVILLVMLARLILKRAPKIFSYALWSVVLFRLLCPVAFTAPVSVLNALEPEVQEASESTSVVYFIPAEVTQDPDFTFIPAKNQSEMESVQAEESQHSPLDLMTVASYVWLTGTGIMMLYSVIQYIRLRGKLVGAVVYRGNVYRADYIDTPFVMGIFSPKIYLPSDVPMNERKYIIAHERHHIRRCDHIIKLLAYLALCIHWFNPLVWAAFILAGKDMEMSCDEAVIRKMGSQIRADYSASLLRLATHKKIIAGMPLAFGEGDTKGRVMNMAKWKKPKLWVSVICLLLCVAILVACAMNPASENENTSNPTTQGKDITLDFELITCSELKVVLPKEITSENSASNEYTFYSGDTVVGGLTLRNQKGARWTEEENTFAGYGVGSHGWQKAIGVPEASDESFAYMAGGSIYADSETTYSPDLPLNYDADGNIIEDENGKIVLENEVTHYFFMNGNDVYDLWLYDNRIREELQIQILDSVQIGEAEASTAESAGEKLPVTDVELAELPAGFSRIFNETGGIFFVRDNTIVGGVDAYPLPKEIYDPNDQYFSWLEKSGISDFGDSSLCYMGGMTFTGTGSWGAQFASDVPDGVEPEVERYHSFKVVGDLVYDIWYDMKQLTHEQWFDLQAAVILPEGDSYMATEPSSDEDIAFEKVRSIYDTLQDDASAQILVERINDSNEGPKGYAAMHYWHEGNWLGIQEVLTEGTNITEAGAYYNRQAYMIVDDRFFTNEGHWGETGDIQWQESAEYDVSWVPNLTSFVWNKSYVAYIDTMEDERGICYMYRIDKMFDDMEGYTDHYFANYYFDKSGNFLYAQFQVNLFQDNAFTVTESIVSLDPETVNAEIQKEYQHAVG